MKFNDYWKLVGQFEKHTYAPRVLYQTTALAGEVGEFANEVKKQYRDDAGSLYEARREKMIDELGDVLWYVACLADSLGTDLQAVAEKNYLKLQARHSKTPPPLPKTTPRHKDGTQKK